MALISKSSLATIALATGLVLASGAGGAVAGSMVTGKQIKNNTVTTKDIKNGTLQSADLSAPLQAGAAPGARPLAGYELVTVLGDSVAAGASGSARATCPAGKQIVGGSGSWYGFALGDGTLSRVYFEHFENGTATTPTATNANSIRVMGTNDAASSLALKAYAICATVG